MIRYVPLPLQARLKVPPFEICQIYFDLHTDDLLLEREGQRWSYLAHTKKAPVFEWSDWHIELIDRPDRKALTPEEAKQLIADRKSHEQATIPRG